jgi:TPR repeat protein
MHPFLNYYHNPATTYETLEQKAIEFQGLKGTAVHTLAEAFNWYLKSANNGEMMAMDRLASFYENGQGVIKDLQKAKKWKQRYDAEINKMFQKK